MLEDQTLDIACPKCGHLNSILVREFEEHAETHFVCGSCNTGVRIEAEQFHKRLDDLRKELEELTRDVKPPPRRRKGDFQI